MDSKLKLVFRTASVFPLGKTEVGWRIRGLGNFSEMLLDVFQTFGSTSENLFTQWEATDIVEEIRDFALANPFQLVNF